jgi:Tfp pilus assembly protein PilF/lipoprotein NlpI
MNTLKSGSYLVLLLAALALAGCANTFITTEVRRPIVVDTRLSDESEVHQLEALIMSGISERDRWLPVTNQALRLIAVQKYGGFQYQIVDLANSLDDVPVNPYGWIYLGMYLMLQKQPQAAVEAADSGIRLLEASRAKAGGRTAALDQLYTVALLNKALAYLSLERFDASIASLSRVEDPSRLDAFRRVAYHWISAQASSALRRTDDARKSLAEAKAISLAGSSTGSVEHGFNYPQYFSSLENGPNRKASEFYIEGMIELDANRLERAIELFGSALKVHPSMWEAHFGLARAYIAAKRHAEARDSLENLLASMPADGYFNREAVHFTLANLHQAQSEFEGAEAAYVKAIEESAERLARYSRYLGWRHLKTGKPAGALVTRTLEKSRQGYPEAENNLALLLIERVELGNVTAQARAMYLTRAATLLRRVIEDPSYRAPHIAHTNLARVYLLRGEWVEMVMQATLALQKSEHFRPALDLLLAAAEKNTSLEEAGMAYTIAFDALSRGLKFNDLDDSYKRYIKSARARLVEGPEGREQARALSRLYLLTGEWSAGFDATRSASSKGIETLNSLLGQARIELSSGDLKAAEEYLAKALAAAGAERGPASDVDRRDVHFYRSLIQAEKKQLVAARKELEEARTIWPGWKPY